MWKICAREREREIEREEDRLMHDETESESEICRENDERISMP